MNVYPSLIAEVCETPKTTELVARAIPILIRWAQNGVTTNHYKDLNRELGYKTFRAIGHVLGCVDEVLKRLSKKPEFKNSEGKRIPTLNALCTNISTNLPSYGFDYVAAEYDSMSLELKRILVKGFNADAINYKKWDRVLKALGLTHSVAYSKKDNETIKKTNYSHYTESQFHKDLKQYVREHPKSIGLTNIMVAENEAVLLSGDRLDVYFQQKDKTKIAVEVKSRISPDDDILRGIYQCVKYKAVLEAENQVLGESFNVRAILVIEGTLSNSNHQVKDSLGIEVIENYKFL